MNFHAPVLLFGISAFIAIAFGLHIAHISAVGFPDFVKEVMKKHELSPCRAEREARFSFWFAWAMVIVFGICATAFLAISIIEIVNPNKIW